MPYPSELLTFVRTEPMTHRLQPMSIKAAFRAPLANDRPNPIDGLFR